MRRRTKNTIIDACIIGVFVAVVATPLVLAVLYAKPNPCNNPCGQGNDFFTGFLLGDLASGG